MLRWATTPHSGLLRVRPVVARFVAFSDWNVRSRGTPIQRNNVYCGVLRTGRGGRLRNRSLHYCISNPTVRRSRCSSPVSPIRKDKTAGRSLARFGRVSRNSLHRRREKIPQKRENEK
ncbi:unnamed protein product [Ixodes persulcatus]